MSHRTYDDLWRTTQESLAEVCQTDTLLLSAKPDKDRVKSRRLVAELYTKYALAVNSLDECYDQTVQPQKRPLLRRLLDACIGRFLELKYELVNLDLCEVSYLDDVLIDMGLYEASIRVPRYFRREREDELRKRKDAIDSVLKKLGFYQEEAVGIEMTEVEAVRAIQIHERARQGRLRAQFMKEIRLMKEKGKSETTIKKPGDGGKSALKIQKTWRGYNARRIMKRRKLEEMVLIGMLPPTCAPTEARKRAEQVMTLRHETQRANQIAFDQAVEEARADITYNRGGEMREEITDQVRAWYNDHFAETGKFPDLPSEESGGSALVFQRQGADSERSKSSASSRESRKSNKKAKEKDGGGKEDGADEEDVGFKAQPSCFLADVIAGGTEYEHEWRGRVERDQAGDIGAARLQIAGRLEAELRRAVDSAMRKELEALQAALDRTKGRKGKKSSKKKGRSGRKSKKKKERDLTPDRTLESLVEELVTNGILKQCPEKRLTDFFGERSFATHDLRAQGIEAAPALGDIRQALLEIAVLPLGSATVHASAPLVRSLLLVGPSGSGKRLLANAVCHEAGAALFDLSPANTVGKYPGKSGLIMLVHLVSKVSRLLQPSVIFMHEAEKPFLKKVPKTDKTDPKRLKKDLPKLVKNIGPEDRVLLLGVSTCPWECDQKALAQTYGRFLLVPRPDLGSLTALWSQQLLRFSGVSRQFDAAAATKCSDGFAVAAVIAAVEEVMTCKRVLQLRSQPLTHAELINALSKHTPIYREEEEAFAQWFSKTPLGRRKARQLEIEAELKATTESQVPAKKK